MKVGGTTSAGQGYITLTAANTYTGATSVSGGTLQVGNGTSGSIDSSSSYTTSIGNPGLPGTLALYEANGSIFAGSIANGGNVAGVEGTGITNTFSGVISGAGTFSQTGSGASIVTNNDTYTGAPTITHGTVQVGAIGGTTGSLSGTTGVTVNTGGTLLFW